MAQTNTRLSPRQKMINLMYIVLTAMLALNVSSDVLDGFTQVHDGLSRTNETVSERNDAVYDQIRLYAEQNPLLGQSTLESAMEVRARAKELFERIDSFKNVIIIQADGVLNTPDNLQNRDDLEAASVVMLNPSTRHGESLRNDVDIFRSYIQSIVVDSLKRSNIEHALSTAPFKRPGIIGVETWEESKFDNQPAVAAITLLTKLQNDVRYAEGEALATLIHQLSQIDAGDLRINEMNAFVVPQSRMVMRGGRYAADIVLAAVDTTARPTVYVGGKPLTNGHYEFTPSSIGSFNYSGYIEVKHVDGTTSQHPFTSQYTVFEPMATVSATMMNVLYAGINNPISISVPGVPMADVTATMTGGTLSREGDHWVARSSSVGGEAVVTVSAMFDGRSQVVNTTKFKVRKLPDPDAFIILPGANGSTERFKGGRSVSKQQLMSSKGLGAAIDDGLLDIDFRVLGFETVFIDSQGDGAVYQSDGANFSSQQKDRIRGLVPGRARFFISRIRATGPDGVERVLSPIEVRVK
ncbi:MAG: gliding motility protein GldM [Bacteroides sp.]|nr:gliding motility protein GldM [Bacteroides sp.]MCM1414001.1 gliding motility protein GldM [Bacteroides sp.]MCM1472304.1 gliding motility protein GldM [Bacteroides sp.]